MAPILAIIVAFDAIGSVKPLVSCMYVGYMSCDVWLVFIFHQLSIGVGSA